MWLYTYIYIYLPSQTRLNQILMCPYVVYLSFFFYLTNVIKYSDHQDLLICVHWHVYKLPVLQMESWKLAFYVCHTWSNLIWAGVTIMYASSHTSTASVRVDTAHAQTMISIPLLSLDSLSPHPNYDLSCLVWIAGVHTKTMESLSPQSRYCQNKTMTL